VLTERKRRLDGTVTEFRCEPLRVEPGKRAVVRFVTPADRRLDGTDLTLPAGTVTIGHFWADRSYTVYAFRVAGAAVGWYCSIADAVTIGADSVEYLDLVVDVLIDPKGTATVLDEDELPADIEPRHRRTINEALETLTGNTRRLIAEVEAEGRPYL
jgi:predicted RNA-binding protein associated with RNAse of E/G family